MLDATGSGDGVKLLDADDPAPFTILRADGDSPFFFTCEHAGKRIPKHLGTLGLDAEDRERHIAWDIGAAEVARQLSRSFNATVVLQTYSRLVCDCNRSPAAHDFITTLSEDTTIPGNIGVTEAQAKAREVEIFHPYHDRIRAALDARAAAGRETVLISVHSCTPVFHGVSRPWQVGVLYERDPRFARIVLELLRAEPGLCVGDNQPYQLSGNKDYAIPVHGEQRSIPHLEFEIRQDLIGSTDGQQAWAKKLHAVLEAGYQRLHAE